MRVLSEYMAPAFAGRWMLGMIGFGLTKNPANDHRFCFLDKPIQLLAKKQTTADTFWYRRLYFFCMLGGLDYWAESLLAAW